MGFSLLLVKRQGPCVNMKESGRDAICIKSSGKFAIFGYLKIDGGGGRMQITEKWHLKIKTVEYIDVKMT